MAIRSLILLLLTLLPFSLAFIGYPKPECPQGLHYCQQRPCPFDDANFCANVVPTACADPFSSACTQALAAYCPNNPNDPGCDLYNCVGAKPYRCSDFICAASADTCLPYNPAQCAFDNDPCGPLTVCSGKFQCSNSCRDTLGEVCPTTDRCGPYYDCGNNLCSTDPLCYNYLSVPGECNGGGTQIPNYCYSFRLDGCSNYGFQYCGYSCGFENQTFCGELNQCYQQQGGANCQVLASDYCRDINPLDLGCCPTGLRCPNGICVNDLNDCNNWDSQNNNCYRSDQTCPYTSPCPGQHFCGWSNNGPVCRATLSEPCNQGNCAGDPARKWVCGNQMCSGDPADCVFGPLQGECNNGEHHCGGGCPFTNYTFCQELNGICNPNVTQTCLDTVDAYCQSHPGAIGCCTGSQVRCLPSGICRNTQGECPGVNAQTCVVGNATCELECPGAYYCGRGASCVNVWNQRCTDGPCARRFYCGEQWGVPVCSDDPTNCRPPIDGLPAPRCANGEHFCGENTLCPFTNQSFCQSLDHCNVVGFEFPPFDQLSAACRADIDAYCAVNTQDIGCCNGNTPHRCQRSYRCAANANECTSFLGCYRIADKCPAHASCPNGYYCGDQLCINSLAETCPVGSPCQGRYYCDNGQCTDNAGQCDPIDGVPLPTCFTGLTCPDTKTCQRIGNVVDCFCKQGFQPDLGNPDQCVPVGGNNGGVAAGCVNDNECGGNNFICLGGACTCAQGTTFNPNTRVCENINNPNPPVDAQCVGSGDVHYTTFDNIYYDYQGYCDLIAVRSPTLEVHLRPTPCGSPSWPVSCVQSLAVKTGTTTIILDGTSIVINGSPVTVPYSGNGITISNPSWTSDILLPDGALISFAPYHFQIKLPPSYQSITEGLCSNWSNSASNNYRLTHRDGSVTVQNQNYGPANAFAQSWKVDDQVDTVLFPTPNTNCANSPVRRENLADLCNNDTVALSYAVTLCAEILTPSDPQYANCYEVFDMSRFYRDCIYDVCITQQAAFAQRMLYSAIAACQFEREGINGQTTTGAAAVTGSSVTGSATGDESDDASTFSFSALLLLVLILLSLLF